VENPPLTARQAEILEAIRNHISETAACPRPEPPRRWASLPLNGVFKHLAALAKKGAIELAPTRRAASVSSKKAACP
jgi:repressor LexA